MTPGLRVLPLPEAFRVKHVAATGEAVLVSGFARGQTAPSVWVGRVEATGELRWLERLTVGGHVDEETEPALSADERGGVLRVAVSRRGEHWHDAPLVFQRSSTGKWATPAPLRLPWDRADRGTSGYEFELGYPLLVRGDELFTMTFPGAPVSRGRLGEASSTVLHAREGEGAWPSAALPFAEGAAQLGWHLALSSDGAVLFVGTEHRDKAQHLDLYVRSSPSAPFAFPRSLRVAAPPQRLFDVAFVGPSLVVATSEHLAVYEGRAGEWGESRRVVLPSTEAVKKGVGASLALLDVPVAVRAGGVAARAAYVSRADGARFLVSPAGRVRVLPEGPAPSAASATHLYAVRGGELLELDLPTFE